MGHAHVMTIPIAWLKGDCGAVLRMDHQTCKMIGSYGRLEMHNIGRGLIGYNRQASFIKLLMAEQRRHVSCIGDGGN